VNRPSTLRDIAEFSESLEDFGRYFQDWLHGLLALTSRPQVVAAISDEPRRLAKRFSQGAVADAWLAAYADFIAQKIRVPAPAWTDGRISPEPWFAVGGSDLRSRLPALRDSPNAFKSRNLYTPTVTLPLQLSAGRPAKTAEELKHNNALRQKRFRERRRAELRRLRKSR